MFEAGHALTGRALVADGLIPTPPFFQVCLGMDWLAPATPQAMIFLRDLLPAGAVWSTFGESLALYPMVAQGVLLGGQVRVGLEDSLYLNEGVLAPGNAAMVEKAVRLIRLLGAEPASAAEARAILGLEPRA